MTTRRGRWVLHLLLGGCALCATVDATAQAARLSAPNVVEISPRLVTSGQPSAVSLATLKAQGFDAVIYLASPTVMDAVRDENLIVARQGLIYINLPIRFDNPTEADFDAFASLLRGLDGRKVLVHCQVNMRVDGLSLPCGRARGGSAPGLPVGDEGLVSGRAMAQADRGPAAQAQDRLRVALKFRALVAA